MSETRRHIEDVQKQTNADDVALGEARARRNEVLAAGLSFPGIAGSYVSGSVATAVVTGKVEDADGGVIADRRCFPDLGPDGGGDNPAEPVSELQTHIGPLIRETRPKAVVRRMKRGLRIFSNEPLADGQDPYVDLVFALQRSNKPGLWIPNLEQDRWDAAHPQEHVALLIAGTRSLRRTRAQVIRLGKVWNKQFAEPALNSFNVCALALECITAAAPIEQALRTFFTHAAESIAVRRTEDPARASGPIGLELTKDVVVARLEHARAAIDDALDADDDPEAAQEAMHRLYFGYVPEPGTASSKEQLAERLRFGTPRLRPVAGGLVIAGATKTMRSFGGPCA